MPTRDPVGPRRIRPGARGGGGRVPELVHQLVFASL